jgi:hypothetical protein
LEKSRVERLINPLSFIELNEILSLGDAFPGPLPAASMQRFVHVGFRIGSIKRCSFFSARSGDGGYYDEIS